MKNIAVLTNDLQYELVEKNQERINAVEAGKKNFCHFLKQVRSHGGMIIHLQLINDPNDPNAERYGHHLPVQKGTKGAEIIKDFLEPGDIIVEKSKDSGFFETGLDNLLKNNGIDTVIITGMQTQICVQTTASDAFFRGYNVWVPEDGVVSARQEDKDRALIWLDGYCATVSDTGTILAHMEKGEVLPRKSVHIP